MKQIQKDSMVSIAVIIVVVAITAGVIGWLIARNSIQISTQNTATIQPDKPTFKNQQAKSDTQITEPQIPEPENSANVFILKECLEDDNCLFIKETNKIAKTSSADNGEALTILNSDGSNKQVLVERKFSQFDGKLMDIIGYSDGGKYIYYSPEQPDGLGGAYIFGGVYGGMNKVNTENKLVEKILTTENTGAIYNVSKDGNWVAYETYAGDNIPYYYPRLNKKAVDFNGLILKALKNNGERKISHRKGYIRFGNSIFSPDSTKIAYEEEKGEDPELRQYDAVVENVTDGSGRAIFENCSLAASEWEKNKNSWINNRYLLIHCSDKKYYQVDTKNNNNKEKIKPTEDMKKWNISDWNNTSW